MRVDEKQAKGGETQRQGRPWYLLGIAHSTTWLEHHMPTLGMYDGDDPEISFSLYSPASSMHIIEHQLHAWHCVRCQGYGNNFPI